MQIINLTPHDIHFCDAVGTIVRTIPRSGQQARCTVCSVPVGDAEGIPLVVTQFGAAAGLPAPQPATLYIVSLLVRQALPERTDLASPDDMVRDAAGQIIGCRNLAINALPA